MSQLYKSHQMIYCRQVIKKFSLLHKLLAFQTHSFIAECSHEEGEGGGAEE